MADEEIGGNRIVSILYVPLLCIILLWMLVWSSGALCILIELRSVAIEPDWYVHVTSTVIYWGSLLSQTLSSDSSQMESFYAKVNPVFVAIYGAFMGLYVRRYSAGHKFETCFILGLLLLGILQWLVYLSIPDPQSARDLLADGDKLVAALRVVLNRNIVLSAALTGIAFGVGKYKEALS